MKKSIIFGMFLAIALISFAKAAVVFRDNFENITAVHWPDPNSDADPNAAIGRWVISEDRPNGVQVISNSMPGAYNGGKYIIMDRWSFRDPVIGEGATALEGAFSTAASGGKLTVTFAFNSYAGLHEIYLVDAWPEDTWSDSNIFIDLRITPSGSIQNQDFNAMMWVETGLTAAIGEWNELRIAADFDTGYFDLYLNGVKAQNLYCYGPWNSGAKRIYLYNYLSPLPSTWYLDNFTVETGTPSCSEPLRGDFNGDCKINLQDFAKMAGRWLDCNLDPVQVCRN